MEQIDRWNIYIQTGQIVEELDKNGDWVFYDDYLSEVFDLRSEILRLESDIDDLRSDLEYARNN